MSNTSSEVQTPYQRAAVQYAEMGWSPVPITRGRDGKKGVPVEGFTGQNGKVVTPQLATALANRYGGMSHPQIAVRAVTEIGVDVDAYDGRDGAKTLACAEDNLGKLPATWRSSARETPSGVLWFKVPEQFDAREFGGSGLDEFGPNVDIIRWGHRFALVWPSVHPTGAQYRWYGPDGSLYDEGDVPDATALPELPEAWCRYLLDKGSRSGSVGWDGVDRSDEIAPGHSLEWERRIIAQIGQPIPNGKHEATLYGFARDLRQHGATWGEALEKMAQRIADCRPAWAEGRPAMSAEQFCTWQLGRAWRECEPPDDDCGNAFCGLPHTENWAMMPPKGQDDEVTIPQQRDETRQTGRHLKVVRASEIQQAATLWLWGREHTGFLPLGELTLIGGREGIGKSTWAYRIAAQTTRGELEGDLLGQPRSVVVCATEDAWAQTIVPRLVAANADLDRVFRVDVQVDDYTTGLTLPADSDALQELCQQEQVALVLLDPLMGTVDGKLDTHKDADVRRALEPLSRLAHEGQIALIGLIHVNKNAEGDLLTQLMASRAFAAVARSVLIAVEEPSLTESDEPDVFASTTERLFRFGQAKNNLGAQLRSSFRYTIEGVHTGHDRALNKEIHSSRIVVLEEVEESIQAYVDRMKSKRNRSQAGQTARDRCGVWLISTLEEAPGLVLPAAHIVELGLEAGFSAATVNRAKSDRGIQHYKESKGGAYWWKLPSGS